MTESAQAVFALLKLPDPAGMRRGHRWTCAGDKWRFLTWGHLPQSHAQQLRHDKNDISAVIEREVL